MVGVPGHHADVGGDDAALQGEGQVHDALGLLDELGVQVGVTEAVAQIAAEGGEDQSVGFEHTQELGALGGSHVLGGVLTVGGVHLDALGADLGGLGESLGGGETEGFQHDADGEWIHG